ncbi:MAG: zinc ribbon domain-containing protein [Longimicrobiaceae bacterium]
MSDGACPGCGADATGRFCTQCGVALEAECGVCGSPLQRGARFCNECGAPVGAADSSQASLPTRPSSLPWILTGALALALLAVFVFIGARGDEAVPAGVSGVAGGTQVAAPTAPAPLPSGDARAVDLASMSPREAADRLFNRVMQAVSSDDGEQAAMFLPMAIAAYGRVQPLTIDDRYHLALLRLSGGEPAAAAAQADTILAADPSHLFGLAARAEAARREGDTDTARTSFRRFLDLYDEQLRRGLTEYGEHVAALRGARAEAEAYLSGDGG